MICNCKDFEENIGLLNAPIQLEAIRYDTCGYTGKPINYCPWCGSKLIKK